MPAVARVPGYRAARRVSARLMKSPDRHDLGNAELPEAKQVFVFTDDEVRLCGGSAFEDAVVGGILLYGVQGFSRGDVITEGEQFAARVLERIAIPLELVAKHADLLQYRVRNVDADGSGPRVADD